MRIQVSLTDPGWPVVYHGFGEGAIPVKIGPGVTLLLTDAEAKELWLGLSATLKLREEWDKDG